MTIKRTFPGCVKSFSGYPLKDGQDDLSSLQYLACVLKKMYAANKEEQNLLPKKEADLVTLLLNTLKDVILLQPDIVHLYDVKRNYLRTINSSDSESGEERKETRVWPHFLPPISSFTISIRSLEIVSPPGSKNAHIMNIFLVKNQALTLSLVEYVREIVARKNILFQTKSGKAYITNACCEELLAFPPKSVLRYFQEEDPAIEKIVSILSNLGKKIRERREMQKAMVLSKERNHGGDEILKEDRENNTKRKTNPIFSYEPAIFYAVLIHYCKLNSEIYPIPADLETICSKKPVDWMPNLSMPEKIEVLESQNIRTNARKTITLMNTVHQRNPVSIVTSIDISPENRIQMAVNYFLEINSDLPSVERVAHRWVESYESEGKGKADRFDLEKENQKMQKEWFSFIQRNAKKKPTQNVLKKMSKSLYDFETHVAEIPLSNLVAYQKSIVYRIGIIYPSFLNSTMQPSFFPKHWGLIESDIFSNYLCFVFI